MVPEPSRPACAAATDPPAPASFAPEDWRAAGRRAGEDFEARLRLIELGERGARVTALLVGPPEEPPTLPPPGVAALAETPPSAPATQGDLSAAGLSAEPDGVPPSAAPPSDEAGAYAATLERELERHREFHRRVLRSRSWRLLQALRRPFGRAW